MTPSQLNVSKGLNRAIQPVLVLHRSCTYSKGQQRGACVNVGNLWLTLVTNLRTGLLDFVDPITAQGYMNTIVAYKVIVYDEI